MDGRGAAAVLIGALLAPGAAAGGLRIDIGRIEHPSASAEALRATVGWNGDTIAAHAVVRGLAFIGASAAEGVDATLDVRARRGPERIAFELTGSMSAGLLYLTPGFTLRGMQPGFTLQADAAPFTFDAALAWHRQARRLEIDGRFRDPDVGVVEGAGVLAYGEQARLEEATLNLPDARAGPLYATYLRPLLAGTALDALEIDGRIAGRARLAGGRLAAFELELDEVHAHDAAGRFYVAGLDGRIGIHDGPEPRRYDLRWNGAGLYGLLFGSGRVQLASSAGELALEDWTDVALLDGAVAIDALELELTDDGPALALSGRLAPVSMLELTGALGWPLMEGELSGELRGLRYAGGDLRLDGELDVEVFGGRVVIRGLAIEDLFGTVPELEADVDIEDLDLAQLTGRFSFGRIEGRLGGYVRGLRLVAWEPVYFEAELATPRDDHSRHRISQRAVDNLGLIGGGTAGVASRGLMGLFDEYSYGRLGVGCRLYNGYCQLTGVQEAENGFYILTRGGVLPPWIEIKGTGRSIAWDALVEGLKTIARGEVRVE